MFRLSSLSIRSTFALVVVLLVAPRDARSMGNCIRLANISANGCGASFGAGGVAARDPLCGFAPIDCNQDGQADLYVPYSDATDPVTFSLANLCPDTGVASVRFRFASQYPTSRWRALDAAGNVLDQENVVSTGSPQWVELDGQGGCIERVEVETSETCIIGICYRCKLHVGVEIDSPTHVVDDRPVLDDAQGVFTLSATLSSRLPEGRGVEAWTVAGIATHEIVDVGFRDTVVDADAGYFDGGFARAEVVELDSGNRFGESWRTGVVSAVILSLRSDVTLPSHGTESILRVAGRVAPLDAGERREYSFRVLHADEGRLEGSGEPVSTTAVIDGETFHPSVERLDFWVARPERPTFERGDVNADSEQNMADVIYELGHLFLGGPAPVCADAADVNDDGVVDLSDVLKNLDYLFIGGAAPSAPFGECGEDPTADRLECGEFPPCA